MMKETFATVKLELNDEFDDETKAHLHSLTQGVKVGLQLLLAILMVLNSQQQNDREFK